LDVGTQLIGGDSQASGCLIRQSARGEEFEHGALLLRQTGTTLERFRLKAIQPRGWWAYGGGTFRL